MPEELLQGQKNQLPNLSVSKIMLTENSKKKKKVFQMMLLRTIHLHGEIGFVPSTEFYWKV